VTRKTRPLAVGLALAALAFASSPAPLAAQGLAWPQWGRTPQHIGASPVTAQPAQAILAEILYDPFVEAMKADNGDELLAHYAAPLIDDSRNVYMAFKTGEYQGFGVWDSMTWTVRKLRRTDAGFETAWTFVSDWKPEPLDLTGWESVFQPALSGHDLYVPGLGGTVFRVNTLTGDSEARVNPFSSIDPSRYVAGGLAVAPDGSVIYNVLGLDDSNPIDTTGGWLVRVEPEGGATRVDYATFVPGAPSATDACEGVFARSQRPWPPSSTAAPPSSPCGAQRPGINTVPAIAEDGTIYTLSRAHFNDRYGYLVAVHPDLTPAWSASLRGILNDGCGVVVPIDDSLGGCRTGAHAGVDPATNDRPAGRVSDQGTASPVVLPDGTILVGTDSSYNYARGHLMRFDAGGAAVATYDFGWDITPAVFAHGGTYSILTKDNHYFGPTGTSGRYEITSLSPDLEPKWFFPSTETLDCARDLAGTMVCVDDGAHPEGFEWCVNQPAVDANGVAFAGSEDGFLYVVDATGAQRKALFLDTALGAAYTPVSIGPDGVVYVQNNGILFAVGVKPFAPSPRLQPVPAERPASARTVVR
jgi:outer membrane protein assembly factor BamB